MKYEILSRFVQEIEAPVSTIMSDGLKIELSTKILFEGTALNDKGVGWFIRAQAKELNNKPAAKIKARNLTLPLLFIIPTLSTS